MTGTTAAGAIARVNSLGNLSGFVAPYLIGAITGRTGSFSIACAVLAILPFASMVLLLRRRRALHQRATS